MNVIYLGAVIGFFQSIPWNAVFMITQFFGLRLYLISRTDDCMRIQRRAGNRFSEVGNGGKGQGYSAGRWYILYLSANGTDLHVWLVATKKSYEYLTADVPLEMTSVTDVSTGIQTKVSGASVNIIQRMGSFDSPWLRAREIKLALTPYAEQMDIMTKIIGHYETHKHSVAYIWGPPGRGKSMIGLLLAQRLKGSYCNSLKPWQPNDKVDMLYWDIEPTEETPTILVFDEVDSVLSSIHAGEIAQHKHLPTVMKDKSGWNAVLDNIQRGFYPHLILLLTTNKSPDYINGMDPSYIRDGRVNLVFEL